MDTTPGRRVRQLRERLGFKSLTAFSEASGLKIGALSSIESDRSAPSFDTLATLQRAFPAVRVAWLLTGTGAQLHDEPAVLPTPPAAAPTAAPAPELAEVRASFATLLAQRDATIAQLTDELRAVRKEARETARQQHQASQQQNALAQAYIANLESQIDYLRAAQYTPPALPMQPHDEAPRPVVRGLRSYASESDFPGPADAKVLPLYPQEEEREVALAA